MPKGEMNTAAGVLERMGGWMESTPTAILKRTRYHGHWVDFLNEFPGTLTPAGPNRFLIALPDVDPSSESSNITWSHPEDWAEFAGAYLIGEDIEPEQTVYKGTVGQHHEALGYLAATLGESGFQLDIQPWDTSEKLVTELDQRGIYYQKPSLEKPEIQIYGGEVLQHTYA